MKVGQLEIDLDWVRGFSERHGLAEFSIFGSALRDDFRADSDVDVLFELIDPRSMSIEKYLEMQEELTAMFGREAHLCEKQLLDNPFRRHEILTTRRRLYVRPAA